MGRLSTCTMKYECVVENFRCIDADIEINFKSKTCTEIGSSLFPRLRDSPPAPRVESLNLLRKKGDS